MAPASLHGAFICMAPSSLQGALINGACSLQSALHQWRLLSAKRPRPWRLLSARRPHLAMCEGALHPTHGAPCAFSITSQLPHERGVPKETLLPSSSRSCEPPLSTPSGLRLGSGSTRPTTRAARLVRHRRHALRDPFGTKDQATHEHTADSALSASCSASTSRPLHFVLSTVGIGHIATAPNATKPRRTAVRAARSRLLKAQLDTTCTSSKRAPGRSATAAIGNSRFHLRSLGSKDPVICDLSYYKSDLLFSKRDLLTSNSQPTDHVYNNSTRDLRAF